MRIGNLLLVLSLLAACLSAAESKARPVPKQIEAVLRARTEQRSPKMKLGPAEARAIAGYFAALPAELVRVAALAERMPHSAVELVSAMHERGVPSEDAEAMADFLLRMSEAGKFKNLRQLDINHSHVIGRDWPQIDYSGERMTWQGQKAFWEPKGVKSFKKAEYLAAYFRHASRMSYFKRIYKPTARDFVPEPRPRKACLIGIEKIPARHPEAPPPERLRFDLYSAETPRWCETSDSRARLVAFDLQPPGDLACILRPRPARPVRAELALSSAPGADGVSGRAEIRLASPELERPEQERILLLVFGEPPAQTWKTEPATAADLRFVREVAVRHAREQNERDPDVVRAMCPWYDTKERAPEIAGYWIATRAGERFLAAIVPWCYRHEYIGQLTCLFEKGSQGLEQIRCGEMLTPAFDLDGDGLPEFVEFHGYGGSFVPHLRQVWPTPSLLARGRF
ncbi:MAG: hypothetical protein JXR96_15145 [Deltaproteobacteria bacterium]|nr:hypothetical protein [Deltaproteobacteria bacterium]